MIGRGAYGRPWFLRQVMHFLKTGERLSDPSLSAQLRTLLQHYENMLSHYGAATGMRIARKHVGWYSKGLPASGEFRAAVNRIDEPSMVVEAIHRFYRPLLERLAA
jgi:tRNA-dihydrouridine synthase B